MQRKRSDTASLEATSDLNVGGQAVIEGVMMRSPQWVTVAVRRASGEIVVKREPYVSVTKRYRFFAVPIIRGAVVLLESLYLGMKALAYSADMAMEDVTEEEEKKADVPSKQPTSERKKQILDSLWLAGTLLLGVGLALFIFFYLPLLLAGLLPIEHRVLFNLTSSLIRLGIFFAYLWAITLWKSMQRIFEYHGAEHKSLFALEAGDPLTVESTQKYSTHHPRCGTSFLLIVMIVSILVFMFLPRPETVAERLLRLAFVPLIGGVSYELIKLSGKKRGARLARVLIAPGLFLQRITTREPDAGQVQVALAALQNCLH